MKVVFDTNIFISAFVIPGSQAEKAVLRIIEGRDVLLLSKGILDELLTVLSTKFSRDKEEISRVAVILSEIGEWVVPSEKIKVLNDDPAGKCLVSLDFLGEVKRHNMERLHSREAPALWTGGFTTESLNVLLVGTLMLSSPEIKNC